VILQIVINNQGIASEELQNILWLHAQSHNEERNEFWLQIALQAIQKQSGIRPQNLSQIFQWNGQLFVQKM
jgi:hypothetical protein